MEISPSLANTLVNRKSFSSPSPSPLQNLLEQSNPNLSASRNTPSLLNKESKPNRNAAQNEIPVTTRPTISSCEETPDVKLLIEKANANDANAQILLANLYLNRDAGLKNVLETKKSEAGHFVQKTFLNKRQAMRAQNEYEKLENSINRKAEYWLRRAILNKHPNPPSLLKKLSRLENTNSSAIEEQAVIDHCKGIKDKNLVREFHIETLANAITLNDKILDPGRTQHKGIFRYLYAVLEKEMPGNENPISAILDVAAWLVRNRKLTIEYVESTDRRIKGGRGLYLPQTKKIFIRRDDPSDIHSHLFFTADVLMHEIAHAVANGVYHSRNKDFSKIYSSKTYNSPEGKKALLSAIKAANDHEKELTGRWEFNIRDTLNEPFTKPEYRYTKSYRSEFSVRLLQVVISASIESCRGPSEMPVELPEFPDPSKSPNIAKIILEETYKEGWDLILQFSKDCRKLLSEHGWYPNEEKNQEHQEYQEHHELLKFTAQEKEEIKNKLNDVTAYSLADRIITQSLIRLFGNTKERDHQKKIAFFRRKLADIFFNKIYSEKIDFLSREEKKLFADKASFYLDDCFKKPDWAEKDWNMRECINYIGRILNETEKN